MVKVKICGITSYEDAKLSVRCGADALGFNFYRKSPRYLSPLAARRIADRLSPGVIKVGVFVDEDLNKVIEIAEKANLDAIQLHGDETAGFVDDLKKRTDLEVIKAFRVGPGFNVDEVAGYKADAVLLDAYSPIEKGGTGESFDWEIAAKLGGKIKKLYLAGGLDSKNVAGAIEIVGPYAVDTCSRVEARKGKKDPEKVRLFISAAAGTITQPDENGYWGEYGGRFVPETLVAPIEELENAFYEAQADDRFQSEFSRLLRDYSGRPTPLFYAKRLSKSVGGAKIYLKREDLNHTGAHKINNALGQILLAKKMGKDRIIAETGAGQHGVATATVAALFGFRCVIYMGTEDMRRQAPNVYRMNLLGAEIRAVDTGSRTLKDAINEALRDWVTNVRDTYYLLGSALGPHPYPLMVREFQSVIGKEARRQILETEGRLPDCLVACVGGGSNSLGLFHPFIRDEEVRMYGVEAGGRGDRLGDHAARFNPETGNKVGVLQGTKSYLLQDNHGQVSQTHSISAGLDYPSIGPEHAYLHDIGRVEYESATDTEALEAFRGLSKLEGIIPALESAHGLAYALKLAGRMTSENIVIVNLSGRGDKDVDTVGQEAEPG